MEKHVMLNTEDLLSRITINPRIMVGKPTIRGMRITVEQILRALSGRVSEQELLEEYPELEKEDFQAVFAYVTGLVEEEQVFLLQAGECDKDHVQTKKKSLFIFQCGYSDSYPYEGPERHSTDAL